MANEVYANGMEVACKAADGKTVAAMPDVCLSPPSPPAGPVPIPYPNTAYASDTTKGSKTVQISGQEVVLKDESTFKKSTGDEAATKSLGMGVVSHQIQGEVNFASWSMDVKIEGANAARHLDLTLHNEMCIPANTPTWPYLDRGDAAAVNACKDDEGRVNTACPNAATTEPEKDCEKNSDGSLKNSDCRAAKRCMLVPYDRKPNKGGCCDEQTGHHVIPAHCFVGDFPGYVNGKAPCVCAEGWSWHRNDNSAFAKNDKTHPTFHEIQDVKERRVIAAFAKLKKLGKKLSPGLTEKRPWKYSAARDVGVKTHRTVFTDPKCHEDCLKKQLDSYHKQPSVGVSDDTPVKAKNYGNRDTATDAGSVKWWKKLKSWPY